MYNPSTTCSTPCEELNTRSWLSSKIKLMVWSKPFSVPYKKKKKSREKDKYSGLPECINSTIQFLLLGTPTEVPFLHISPL